MAAELEQLKKDVRALAKQFRTAGQSELADQLDVDAQSLAVRAKIALAHGFKTFATPSTEPAARTETPTIKVTPTDQDRQLTEALSPFAQEYKAAKVYTPDLINSTWQGMWKVIGERAEHEYQ